MVYAGLGGVGWLVLGWWSSWAKSTSSALPKQKATSLPIRRSLVGVPVLFLVAKYIEKVE